MYSKENNKQEENKKKNKSDIKQEGLIDKENRNQFLLWTILIGISLSILFIFLIFVLSDFWPEARSAMAQNTISQSYAGIVGAAISFAGSIVAISISKAALSASERSAVQQNPESKIALNAIGTLEIIRTQMYTINTVVEMGDHLTDVWRDKLGSNDSLGDDEESKKNHQVSGVEDAMNGVFEKALVRINSLINSELNTCLIESIRLLNEEQKEEKKDDKPADKIKTNETKTEAEKNLGDIRYRLQFLAEHLRKREENMSIEIQRDVCAMTNHLALYFNRLIDEARIKYRPVENKLDNNNKISINQEKELGNLRIKIDDSRGIIFSKYLSRVPRFEYYPERIKNTNKIMYWENGYSSGKNVLNYKDELKSKISNIINCPIEHFNKVQSIEVPEDLRENVKKHKNKIIMIAVPVGNDYVKNLIVNFYWSLGGSEENKFRNTEFLYKRCYPLDAGLLGEDDLQKELKLVYTVDPGEKEMFECLTSPRTLIIFDHASNWMSESKMETFKKYLEYLPDNSCVIIVCHMRWWSISLKREAETSDRLNALWADVQPDNTYFIGLDT